MSRPRGAVACGHPVTRDAALSVLAAGGNAFDAAAAGLWAACAAEPLLASPGGGGFLLAAPAVGKARMYDFFVHTPRRPAKGHLDFHEIQANFGPATQAFHIGLGSVATPGMVAGVCRFHRELGRLPAREVMTPAIEAARRGVSVNAMQAYVAWILTPIVTFTDGVRSLFAPEGSPAPEGTLLRLPELADLLDALARSGPDLFYRGEVAATVDRHFRTAGGHLRRADFEGYEVVPRDPLEIRYRGRRIRTNPPPSSGGLLVALGLKLREADRDPPASAGPERAAQIALTLAAMQEARLVEGLADDPGRSRPSHLLADATARHYLEWIRRHPAARGGTTHISVVDAEGNAASSSVSNGEGCGWAVPGTGMMLNNMLGEKDLHPHGLGSWPTDTRLTSMMAPTILESPADGTLLALGSGGSNRIRSALLQVLLALVDDRADLEDAIARPRLHVEGERLEIEGGFSKEIVDVLRERWPDHGVWPETNLFFGGAHCVASGPGGMRGAGDPRRGGVAGILPGGSTTAPSW